mmetsp:Transcript_39042/g.75717  ORF Transcript_39042/g.75717 Transcript_39042/m.75717 type:complete len:377 (-) Transcript_39042:134-1264(-)
MENSKVYYIAVPRYPRALGRPNEEQSRKIASMIDKKILPAKEMGEILRVALPVSLYEALPGKASVFLGAAHSPVYPKLSYFCLRKCDARCDLCIALVLFPNTPRLVELDASGCHLDVDFLSTALHYLPMLKTLTVREAIIHGNELFLESDSLELLALSASTCRTSLSEAKSQHPTPLRLKFPRLKQLFLDLNCPILHHAKVTKQGTKLLSKNTAGVPPFSMSTLSQDLCNMSALEYLAVSSSSPDVDDIFIEAVTKSLKRLKVLNIDGSTGLKRVRIDHEGLSELILRNCSTAFSLTLDCPNLRHLALPGCPIRTADLHIPMLQTLDFKLSSDVSKVIASSIVRASPDLVELNGLPFDESHPDARELGAEDMCTVS